MAAIIGASWGGAKTMTATSGPGYSLMQENIGLAIMMEAPCVVVNVQRAGPSTGLPTLVGQQDVMQAKWGSHGDYEPIAISPNSIQECFDLAILAFNYAEKYRVPVTILMDETIGHMNEKLVIPEKEKLDIWNRKKPQKGDLTYKPYLADEDLVPPMATAGEGFKIMTTGLTHDEKGYPLIDAKTHEKLVRRLSEKIRKNKDEIIKLEEYKLSDAKIVLISFGISSRAAKGAVNLAREKGIPVGLLRLITIWPFPDEQIYKIAQKADVIIVPEINFGQITREVERASHGKSKVIGLHKLGGSIHTPLEILEEIERNKK